MYIVEFNKEFKNGNLVGVKVKESIKFTDYKWATEYVEFLTKHNKIPLQSVNGSDYICFNIRLTNKGDLQ